MTKEEARVLLEYWINAHTKDSLGKHRDMLLPINDEIINIISTDFESGRVFDQYTFKGLIKIAYDL